MSDERGMFRRGRHFSYRDINIFCATKTLLFSAAMAVNRSFPEHVWATSMSPLTWSARGHPLQEGTEGIGNVGPVWRIIASQAKLSWGMGIDFDHMVWVRLLALPTRLILRRDFALSLHTSLSIAAAKVEYRRPLAEMASQATSRARSSDHVLHALHHVHTSPTKHRRP